jgi:PAS domain S-box-containing protein
MIVPRRLPGTARFLEIAMEARELFALFDDAGDAAFAVDVDGRIGYWSASAERLLGFPSGEMVGRDCAAILDGCDEQGCKICSADCHVLQQARNDAAAGAYELHAATAWGERKWLDVSIVVAQLSDRASPLVVHLMRDAEERKRKERLAREIVERVSELAGTATEPAPPAPTRAKPGIGLTRREVSVLQALAKGDRTSAIAEDLFISPTTVRNHIQRILKKLGCHSRLEAVMRAAREGLI